MRLNLTELETDERAMKGFLCYSIEKMRREEFMCNENPFEKDDNGIVTATGKLLTTTVHSVHVFIGIILTH